MKRAIVLLLGPLCVVFVIGLLIAPQPKTQHHGSSAFQVALERATDRLEGTTMFLAGTATPVKAAPQQPTYENEYRCQTYHESVPTCHPQIPGCGDGVFHFTMAVEYTCQMATCDTYDPKAETCDPNVPLCAVPHTTEPIPYNHTCQGHTCDQSFTCDFTLDPRASTCDAGDPLCQEPTFSIFDLTCDPMDPACRVNNPKGYCTAENMYPTCVPGTATCDVNDPLCTTIDPSVPGCATPIEKTTWGQVKEKYQAK